MHIASTEPWSASTVYWRDHSSTSTDTMDDSGTREPHAPDTGGAHDADTLTSCAHTAGVTFGAACCCCWGWLRGRCWPCGDWPLVAEKARLPWFALGALSSWAAGTPSCECAACTLSEGENLACGCCCCFCCWCGRKPSTA